MMLVFLYQLGFDVCGKISPAGFAGDVAHGVLALLF
jgi:hypothetical protein